MAEKVEMEKTKQEMMSLHSILSEGDTEGRRLVRRKSKETKESFR